MPSASSSKEPSKEKPRKRGGRLKRVLLGLLALGCVIVLVGWMLLPRIAERVIRGMIAEAGLEKSEFAVESIGWNEALIRDVTFADGNWQAEAHRINITYAPLDLLDGQVRSIVFHDLRATLDLTSTIPSTSPVIPPTAQPEQDDTTLTLDTATLRSLPEVLQQVRTIQATNAVVMVKQNTANIERVFNLDLRSVDQHTFTTTLTDPAFVLTAEFSSKNDPSVQLKLDSTHPGQFLALLENAISYDGSFLPANCTIGSASLEGGTTFTNNQFSPLTLTGKLHHIRYHGGDQPVRAQVAIATAQLVQDFNGAGLLKLSGALSKSSFPLDPSADFSLTQSAESQPQWRTSISWGQAHSGVSASLNGLHLAGSYDNQPVALDDIKLDITNSNGTLTAAGNFSNGDTQIPLKYNHDLTDGEQSDHWKLTGNLALGPVEHRKPLPVLQVVASLFEDIDITGKSYTSANFSTGSHTPFQGTVTTEVTDATVSYSEPLVSAEGLNGRWKLNLIPITEETGNDPSFFTLDFSAAKLLINSKEALGFNLLHEAEAPVLFSGKGKLGGETSLSGNIKDLTLYGEKEGKEIVLSNTSAKYQLNGDIVTANGTTSLDENSIPFQYRHEKTTHNDDWKLLGFLQIPSTTIDNPLTSASILVDAIDGKTITGKAAMKMDFHLGSKEDFDGVLTASIKDGTVTFADDGPVIEGIHGNIRMASMKTKHTEEFSRVTAKKIKAFDMEMNNLRLDYKMAKNGDLQLRNIALSALGGTAWLDPFTMPADDADYKFKVRMKRIDLAKLALLFPDFDGKISGRLDGLLPMQYKKGDFLPVRGGMYLTPRHGAKLRYNAGNKFSGGLDPKSQQYTQMKMVEQSLRNLDLKVLSIRLFDPRDKDKAIVMRIEGHAPTVPGSPPIHLNINGFKPDDDTVNFFDLLLKNRDQLNFGL
ncbi:MAG: intermembrane phospholipid transport protein YdbH family protein [Akkermansiaceae bacterium]